MIRLEALTADAFAPFGVITQTPSVAGERYFLTDAIGGPADTTARLHVNHVKPMTLPHAIPLVERHPFATQTFLPLDVARYLVVVMPTASDDTPDAANARAFLASGHVGVIYRTGCWHAPATVLDRVGHFAVLMWRGRSNDDEFFTLPTPLVVEAE